MTSEQLHERLTLVLAGAAGINLANPMEVQAYLARLAPSLGGVVGGNTTCIEVNSGSETIIIDCGSGIRPLGISLMAREFGRGQGIAHIFLTHAHWDHLLGFPFFAPAFVPGNKLIFYAVGFDPQRVLEHQQTAPQFFPIPPNAMPAEKEFVQLREGETVLIGRTVVSNLLLYHPGTSHAFRFDDGESVFVCATDGEYKSLSEASLQKYVDFFSNADVLVFDSQYSLRDVFLSRADWGHSSAIIGVDMAERANVKKFITFHHDPTHSDEQVYNIAAAARDYALVSKAPTSMEVIVGSEGMELFLGRAPGLEMLEERSGPVWTLVLAGQLTATTVDEAKGWLASMLAEAPDSRVLLDMTLLTSLDAAAIKGLLDTSRAQPRAQIAVLAPSLSIRRILEHSGATLKIFRNRRQALMVLTGPAHLRLAAETIGDQYQVGEMLFADEAGVVYQGQDRRAGAPLLVRVVAGQANDPERSAFAATAESWQAVRHPGVLTARALIAADTWLAYICARPEGLSLREWRARAPEWRALWHTAGQLCEALAAIHDQGLIHGDLLPECIVVGEGRAQVARAPLYQRPPEFVPEAYQAPELLCHESPTAPSDVYALGVILYEMFMNMHPFAAETEELQLTLQLRSQPQNLRMRWPEIPPALEAFLVKMLAPVPEDRYPGGAEVLAACQAIDPQMPG
jgi:phosphoribosyl 1,2-cyclic phosphodiesterase/anti-anti-sigma regulatory factor